MLKLEKIAKTLEISITLREKEHFLNKTFIQALLIALGLHLFAGLLFNIHFIKISESSSIFPPAFVEADLSNLSDPSVIAVAEQEEITLKHFVEFKESIPFAPEYFISEYIPQTIEFDKVCEWEKNPFLAFEKQINFQIIPLPAFSKKEFDEPIQIIVSSGIDPADLCEEGWKKVDLSFLNKLTTSTYRIIFSVRLDNQTGSLFWYEFKTDHINKELDTLAEEILKNMYFAINEDLFATQGEVEIIFRKQVKND